MADTPAKKSNGVLIVIGVLIFIGLAIGAVIMFRKSSTTEKTTTTQTGSTETSNTGLSGLLAGLNLTDLHLF